MSNKWDKTEVLEHLGTHLCELSPMHQTCKTSTNKRQRSSPPSGGHFVSDMPWNRLAAQLAFWASCKPQHSLNWFTLNETYSSSQLQGTEQQLTWHIWFTTNCNTQTRRVCVWKSTMHMAKPIQGGVVNGCSGPYLGRGEAWWTPNRRARCFLSRPRIPWSSIEDLDAVEFILRCFSECFRLRGDAGLVFKLQDNSPSICHPSSITKIFRWCRICDCQATPPEP